MMEELDEAVDRRGNCCDEAIMLPRVYAAKSTSDDVRSHSSSGGVFLELARVVIEDGGVVYGCAHDERLRAYHVRCETLEQCLACMGSKYVQSDMSGIHEEIARDLRAERKVLFTGTPCQAASVRALHEDNDLLLTVDIICHGVPSPGVFQQWLQELESIKGMRVIQYEHRPKNMGWRHMEKITWEDGSVDQDSNLGVAWKYLFYENRMLRPSCYTCPYTSIDRTTDITIGDFWKIEDTELKDFRDERGVSAVIVSTAAGERLFRRADVVSRAAKVEDVLLGNPMLKHPAEKPEDRTDVWNELYEDGLLSTMRARGYLVSPLRYWAGGIKRRLVG